MNKIQVKILNEHGVAPGKMTMFLAKLTQRGSKLYTMNDLLRLYDSCDTYKEETLRSIAGLDHGTIKRFTPITVAIVGASRRFLSQIRTHQVGLTFVSASLQYSNYSGAASFVVPFHILNNSQASDVYLENCKAALKAYEELCTFVDNDSAGYAMPQGLRNILIIQGNHESWQTLIRRRTCRRNTEETAYVVAKIWEALEKTTDGEEMFGCAGPDCMWGPCREGRLGCGAPMSDVCNATEYIERRWLDYDLHT
jgi:thymidylate synthase (FAD)